jgi:hypothetical protein
MATRVSWSLEEMIISLFMDETPLICGSGHNPGGRGDATGQTNAVRLVPPTRGDAQRRDRDDEHQEQAGNVHVSRYPEKNAGAALGAPSS